MLEYRVPDPLPLPSLVTRNALTIIEPGPEHPPVFSDRDSALAALDLLDPGDVPASVVVQRYDSNSPYRNALYVAQATKPQIYGQDRIIDNTFVAPTKWTLGAGLAITPPTQAIIATPSGAARTATTAYLRGFRSGDLVAIRVTIAAPSSGSLAGSVKWKLGAGGGDQEGLPLTAIGTAADVIVTVGASAVPSLEFSADANMNVTRFRVFRLCKNHYFEAAGKYWLLTPTNGMVSPADFGARCNGGDVSPTADDEALQNADIFAYGRTVPLRETILFEPRRLLITKTFAPDSAEMRLKLKLGPNFAADCGVFVHYALEPVAIDLNLDIDGNRAAQLSNPAGVPVCLRVQQILGPKTEMLVRVSQAKKGVEILGATEHFRAIIHAEHCNEGLRIKSATGDVASPGDKTPAGAYIELYTSYTAVGLVTSGDGSNATVLVEGEYDIDGTASGDTSLTKGGTFLDEVGATVTNHTIPPYIQILDIGGAYHLLGKLRGIHGGIYINSKYQALFGDGSTPTSRGVEVTLNLQAIACTESPVLFVQNAARLSGQLDINVHSSAGVGNHILELSALHSGVENAGSIALAINSKTIRGPLVLGDLASIGAGHTNTLGMGTGWIRYTVEDAGSGTGQHVLELNKQNTSVTSRTRIELNQQNAPQGVIIRDAGFALSNIQGGNIDWLGQKTLTAIHVSDPDQKRFEFLCTMADDSALSILPPWLVGSVFVDILETAAASAVFFRGQMNVGNTSIAPIIVMASNGFVAANNATAYTGTTGVDGKISVVSIQAGNRFNIENRSGVTLTPRIRLS